MDEDDAKPAAPTEQQQQQSSNNNNAGSDSNSDNSGLVSIGINSFGFNFDERSDAAEQAVAGLGSILKSTPAFQQQRKRKSEEEQDADSEGGYKSDNEDSGENTHQHHHSTDGDSAKPTRKKKKLDDRKREERNQREKERSFRISKQITDLRNLLSNGGIVVPKGTKSSVLTEAANYIRLLQQHQYKSEIDRHQLIQQMQLIGSGAHGPQAAQAIRHFAAQNGVWSLGNFGGVPPKSAMSFYTEPTPAEATSSSTATADSNVFAQHKVEPSEYRFIFNSCGVGMAVASMGGAFMDCNQLFCQLSQYTKQEVVGMTIFNLTDRQDLQRAFDQISQLISPPIRMNEPTKSSSPVSAQVEDTVTFKGAMKNNSRDDLNLCVSLVKGEDGIAKCFCVTLVKTSEGTKPVAASFDAIQTIAAAMPPAGLKKEDGNDALHVATSPAFTSG